MSQPANHPPQQELLEFGLGKLPPDDSQRIEQHLEACPDCCQTVLVLQDDTFVGLVRSSQGKAPATVNADATVDVGVGVVPRHAAAQLPAELRNHSR
jgi:anti-sigma factor RsiW